jgi:transposase-like protein
MSSRKQTSYTDDHKATALAALTANGGNLKRTAQQLGIPRTTLAGWANGHHVSAEVAKTRHQKERCMAEKLEELAHKVVDLMPSKLEAATLSQCAVALGIIIDKMRLLREESTAINETAANPDDQRRFYALLGQALDPYPEAKLAVGRLLKYTSEHGRPPDRLPPNPGADGQAGV